MHPQTIARHTQPLREEITLSQHACDRAREMGLTFAEVALVMTDPEVDYSSTKYGAERRVAQRGDLAVPYDSVTKRAITVLYRRVDQWDRDEVTAERMREGVRT